MNKQELVTRLARESGLRREEVLTVLNGALDLISTELAQGGRVELRGFGIFTVEERKGRPARNPRTGDGVWLPDRKVAAFKVAERLKSLIDNPSTQRQGG